MAEKVIRFRPKFRLIPGALFRFRCFGQKSVLFDHFIVVEEVIFDNRLLAAIKTAIKTAINMS